MIAKERLWRTKEDMVVGEGHKDAHMLLCGKGQEVPKEYYNRVKDGRVSSEIKEMPKMENKEMKPEENKGGLKVKRKKG